MANQYNNIQKSLLVPTTNLWNISQIQNSNIPEELKNLLVQLYQNINLISLVLNKKENGIYQLEQTLSGNVFFPNPEITNATINSRTEYRTVTFFQMLPDTGTLSIPHNIFIPSISTATIIYGAATNTNATSMIPLPFASPTLVDNISLELTATDIVITTGSDRSDYVRVIVVVGLLKD